MEKIDSKIIIKTEHKVLISSNLLTSLEQNFLKYEDFITYFLLAIVNELELPINVNLTSIKINKNELNKFSTSFIHTSNNSIIFNDIKSNLYNLLLKLYNRIGNKEILNIIDIQYKFGRPYAVITLEENTCLKS